jgi:hypothetical protein
VSINVAGELAHLLRKQQMDAFTAQEASGMGPLTSMNHIELRHWMSEACMVVQAAATASLRSACAQFSQSGEQGTHVLPFLVRVHTSQQRSSA